MSKSSWSILVVVFVFLGLLGGGLAIFGLGNERVENEAVVEEQVGVEEVDVENEVPAPIVTGVEEETEVPEEVSEEVDEEVDEEEESAVPEVKKLTQDEEIALVEKYYDLLEDGKLEDAYAMKFEPKESFKKFEGWYENVTSANPHDFTKTGESRYQFTVELKEEGGVEGRYQVIMEIIEGKLLKTVSSKEVYSSSNIEEKVYNSDLKAYVKLVDNGKRSEIYLVRNGVEVFVEGAAVGSDEDGGDVNDWNDPIGDLEFSSSGRYLLYGLIGYEWYSLSVYDTVALKKVHVTGSGDHGFTTGEKYFYECEGTGMTAGYIKVFTVPDFGLKADLKPPLGPDGTTTMAVGGDCAYYPANNVLKYNLWDMENDSFPEYMYYFED